MGIIHRREVQKLNLSAEYSEKKYYLSADYAD
jgi:hypothetical protein